MLYYAITIYNTLGIVKYGIQGSGNLGASQINVSFATINRWEQGHNKPTKKTLVLFKEFCRLNDILFQDIPLNYE